MQNTKRKILSLIPLFMILAFIGFSVVSCTPEGLSIDERLKEFIKDAKARNSLKDHFADATSSSVDSSTLVGLGEIFETAEGTLTWYNKVEVSSKIITYKVDRAGSGTTIGIQFTMKKETLADALGSEDWKVLYVGIDGDNNGTFEDSVP